MTDYDQEDRFTISPFMEEADVTSSVNIVVRGTEDAFGLLGFYSHNQREFAEHEVNYMQVVANIIGMAIEREANKEALKKEVKQSKQYQREILNSNIIERWELGSYLHDNLAQILASIKILINDLGGKLPHDEDFGRSEISKINEVINEGITGIRDLTHDIIPIDIEEEGVAHAFRYLMKQTQKIHQVNCNLETGDIIYEIKNIKLATNLYHVIQEAIKNAAIHGDAENIMVSITKDNGDLQLQVKDDGKGLVDTSESHSEGRGIRIMKYRMELLGGTFNLTEQTESGQTGMIITCTIPLENLVEE